MDRSDPAPKRRPHTLVSHCWCGYLHSREGECRATAKLPDSTIYRCHELAISGTTRCLEHTDMELT